METLTLQELAVKLNGKYWEKGDLKRFYLNRGYSTKKMSTNTFVWQNENGDFVVSCRIDCPSQPHQWIDSQEQEIKDSVNDDICNATSPLVYVLKNKEGKFVDFKNDECELCDCEVYYSKKQVEEEVYLSEGICVYEMNRKEFDLEVERLDKIESSKPKIETKNKEIAKPILRKKVEIVKDKDNWDGFGDEDSFLNNEDMECSPEYLEYKKGKK